MSLRRPLRRPIRRLLLASLVISSAGFAGRGWSATPANCLTDQDCGHGYSCQVSGVVGGTQPACPPNTTCGSSGAGGRAGDGATGAGNAAGSTGTGGTTEIPAVTVSTCQPGPCVTDTDCGPDMVCHTQSISACSGGAAVAPCPPGDKCDTPVVTTEPTCTTTIVSACAFKWQLPCNASADCGDGFICQPSVSGSCSGGSPTKSPTTGSSSGTTSPGASGGTSVPADVCTTTTSFPGSCQAAAASCETDTDCPSDWICQTIVAPSAGGTRSGTGSAGAPAAAGTSGSDAGPVSTGGGGDVGTVPIATVKVCSSPFSPPLRTKGGETGSGTTGSPSGNGGTTGNDVVPPDSGAGTGGVTAGGPAAGGGAGGAHDVNASGPGVKADNSGCSVTPGASPSGPAAILFALFGLFLGRRHRRRG